MRYMKSEIIYSNHDDVIKWKHFPRYWPFVRGIHRLPVNSLHKGQWRGALMFSLICVWINDWVKNRGAGDLRRHRVHYDVTVLFLYYCLLWGGFTGDRGFPSLIPLIKCGKCFPVIMNRALVPIIGQILAQVWRVVAGLLETKRIRIFRWFSSGPQ